MSKWFLARAGGLPVGPVGTDAVLRRIRGGTLSPDTLAWAEGMENWVPVVNLSEFTAEFGGGKGEEAAPNTQREPDYEHVTSQDLLPIPSESRERAANSAYGAGPPNTVRLQPDAGADARLYGHPAIAPSEPRVPQANKTLALPRQPGVVQAAPSNVTLAIGPPTAVSHASQPAPPLASSYPSQPAPPLAQSHPSQPAPPLAPSSYASAPQVAP